MTGEVVDQVISQELALLSPEVRRSAARMAQLLDPGFREIGSSGRFWTRPAVLAACAGDQSIQSTAGVDVSEMVADDAIGDGLILLTYVTKRAGRSTRRSTLWRQSDGRWRALFHQGTPIETSR